jgi:prepilin-type N-terminal cleavage/methylation domain-containing protein
LINRKGFSLLEILLALAILGGALAVLSQIVGTGGDAARSAKELAMARLLCQSKLAEVLVTATSVMPAAVPATPIPSPDSESDTVFNFAVDVAPAAMDGLLAIRVSVEAVNPQGDGPAVANYSITRWVIDPTLGLEQLEADENAAAQAEADAAASATDSGAI